MTHFSTSQARYLRIFQRYVDIETGEILRDDFKQDVVALKQLKAKKQLLKFLTKYGLPYLMQDFVSAYVFKGKIDVSLIRSGILLISDVDKSLVGMDADYSLYEKQDELKLVIPSGVKLNEVKDFLDENWQPFVQRRMRLYRTVGSPQNRRIRASDNRIEHSVLRLKAKGWTHRCIAENINSRFNKTYNTNNIGQIVYRAKHRP